MAKRNPDSDQPAGTRPLRSVKWATGVGAALVALAVVNIANPDTGPWAFLGFAGAIFLGAGVATEWRD